MLRVLKNETSRGLLIAGCVALFGLLLAILACKEEPSDD